MSMISEQIKRLKTIKEELETNGELDCDISSLQYEWSKEIGNAIDTIETLYAKIQANNFNNGWIKCKDRLPELYDMGSYESSDVVLVTNGEHQWMAFYTKDQAEECWRFAECGTLSVIDWTEITAWQELPKVENI